MQTDNHIWTIELYNNTVYEQWRNNQVIVSTFLKYIWSNFSSQAKA